MENFRVWLEQEKAWKATKDEIIRFWHNLRPDTPLEPKPIPAGHKGSTFIQDTIRVTGTGPFINGILARLKDFLKYEAPGFVLDVEYKQALDKEERPIPNIYALYIKVRERQHGV
jgi:hypothetical protein